MRNLQFKLSRNVIGRLQLTRENGTVMKGCFRQVMYDLALQQADNALANVLCAAIKKAYGKIRKPLD